VAFTLQITAPDGSPITNLVPGQEFVLHALAQDLRPSPQGVFAAYFDVTWDSKLAAVAGPLEYPGLYYFGRTGDASTPGLLDEAGAFSGSLAPLDGSVREVFHVRMRAVGSGTIVFAADRADVAHGSDTLIYGENGAVNPGQIRYGSAQVIIGPAGATGAPSTPSPSPDGPAAPVPSGPAPATPSDPTSEAPTAAPSSDPAVSPGDRKPLPAGSVAPEDVRVTIEVEVTDQDGDKMTSVEVGEEFQLKLLLTISGPDGVRPFTGFANVWFPTLLVAPTTSSADVGLAGSTVAAGRINPAGLVLNGDASGMMFSKTFTATAEGTATFTADADDLFGHEIYVTGLNSMLPWSQVTFGATTLTIK
jgi:hypothetical protein